MFMQQSQLVKVQLCCLLYNAICRLYSSLADNMLYCYDCQASFARLRELRKHERTHRRVRHCQQCDKYFLSADAEKAHIRELHQVSVGCQTDSSPARVLPKKTCQRSLHQHRHRQHWQTHRPRWQPATRSERTTPIPSVPSVAVKNGEAQAALQLDNKPYVNGLGQARKTDVTRMC